MPCLLLLVFFSLCGHSQPLKLRPLADTIGFAHTKQQMDSVLKRLDRMQGNLLKEKRKKAEIGRGTVFKTVIAPHDDYSYTGHMYPLALENVKAKTIIIFGVAHAAKNLGYENQIIFDSYTHWRGPYGPVKVSALREEICASLPKALYQVSDSMQALEHSVEAMIPFLQHYNPKAEIISILVPGMNFKTMKQIAEPLAASLAKVFRDHHLDWGKDVAFVISSDAVHYGDEDWGGNNFAFYGSDSAGYKKAVGHDLAIMTNCMSGSLDSTKAKIFCNYTVKNGDHKEYKWTWCGRYSVPLGMLTSAFLSSSLGLKPLQGNILGYSSSIAQPPLPVKDLGMGVTAKASLRHWVGYAALGFR